MAYGTFNNGQPTTTAATACSDPIRSQDQDKRQLRFESDCSFVSRLCFSHVRNLLAIQKQRQFTLDDLWQLDEHSTSRVMMTRLLRLFRANNGNLLVAILKMEWKTLLASGLLTLLSIPFKLAPPLLVFMVLQRVTSSPGDSYQIVALLAALYVANVLHTLLECHAMYLTTRMAGRFVSGCHSLLLHASIPDVPGSQHGSASFLYSYVIEIFGILMTDTHALWSVFVEIGGEIYILSHILSIDWRFVCMMFGVVALLMLLSTTVKSFFNTTNDGQRVNRWKSIEECFRAIQSVKLNAWEGKFLKRMVESRDAERQSVLLHLTSLSFSRGITLCADEFIVGLIFAFVVWKRLPFNPAVAFSSVIVVHLIKTTLSPLVWLTSILPNGMSALKSLERHFTGNATLVQPSSSRHVERMPADTSALVSVQSSFFGYDRNASNAILRNVNINLKRGQLVVVHGQAGKGKTTLIKGLIGQVPHFKGEILVSNGCRVTYCSQEPWVQSLTIRENILFGSPYDEAKYLAVLDACALIDDLRRLPRGDETLVGSRGINLSGGQKARIALARACYADADLYVLDCPLASVDAVVQMDVFRKCIVELLRYKTVVMATHNAEFINSLMVDQLWEVRDQSVTVGGEGTSKVVLQGLSQRVVAYELLYGKTSSRSRPKCEESSHGLWFVPQSDHTSLEMMTKIGGANKDDVGSVTIRTPYNNASAMDNFRLFFPTTAGCVWFLVVVGVCVVVFELCLVSKNFWLAWWSSHADVGMQSLWEYVMVYECLVVGGFGALLFYEVFVSYGISNAAHDMFRAVVRALLYAPLSFYYRPRSGEVLERFITDMDTCDYAVSTAMVALFHSSAHVFGSLGVLSYLLGYAGVVTTLLILLVGLRLETVDVFVQGERLESDIGSMDGGELAEALDGISVIRAFGKQAVGRFVSSHGTNIDNIYRLQFAMMCLNNSEKLRISCLNGLFMVALAFVLVTTTATPAQLGLSVIYILSMNSDAVAFLSSCYRVFFVLKRLHLHGLTSIPPEERMTDALAADPATQSGCWIRRGEIAFEHVWFRYGQSNYALQDVTFTVEAGAKIGVVGRTGSGKSSLAMALFRVHELVRGRIRVDDTDIRSLRLETLRSSINIILQSPMFYRCTIREYLDPFDDYGDNDLWQVLHKTAISSFVPTLHLELHDHGENWSLGQRQLLCLARSLLRPSKIVILDEPFSSIDGESDKQLLNVLSSELRESTVLFVTHRLDQVLTFCEKILVLKDGEVEDFGVVEELVGRSDGVFFELLENTLLTS